MTEPRTYAVAGAKGGVGKTTTAINLGAVFAANGYETVVVELDLPMANVVDFVNLDVDIQSSTTLYDVLTGDAAIEEAVYETRNGLAVVPSGTSLEGYADTDLSYLPDAYDRLSDQFDILIFDTPAGLSRETVVPVRLAEEMVLVSTPRVASVRNAQNTADLAERCETSVVGLVLTKSGTGQSPGAERIAEFLSIDLLGHVPEDDAVPHSQDKGAPVVEEAPNSGAAVAYHMIATKLVEAELSREALRNIGGTERPADGEFTPDQTSQQLSVDGVSDGGQAVQDSPAGRQGNKKVSQPSATAGGTPRARVTRWTDVPSASTTASSAESFTRSARGDADTPTQQPGTDSDGVSAPSTSQEGDPSRETTPEETRAQSTTGETTDSTVDTEVSETEQVDPDTDSDPDAVTGGGNADAGSGSDAVTNGGDEGADSGSDAVTGQGDENETDIGEESSASIGSRIRSALGF